MRRCPRRRLRRVIASKQRGPVVGAWPGLLGGDEVALQLAMVVRESRLACGLPGRRWRCFCARCPLCKWHADAGRFARRVRAVSEACPLHSRGSALDAGPSLCRLGPAEFSGRRRGSPASITRLSTLHKQACGAQARRPRTPQPPAGMPSAHLALPAYLGLGVPSPGPRAVKQHKVGFQRL